MRYNFCQKPTGWRRGTAAAVVGATSMLPSTAWAAALESTPAVAVYTAVAVLTVLVAAVVAAVGLHVAIRTGLVGSERRVVLRRRLRVLFGGTFLLAAVTPYVALNFSAHTLVPFIGGAGLVVAGWVWGAGAQGKVESGHQG